MDLYYVYSDFSTELLSKDITWAGSGAPNTELPATMQFAPADAATSMVEGPKPPSTCNQNWACYGHCKYYYQ